MSGRILLVENIATNRILLRAALQAAHYDVQGVANLAEACKAISVEAPDMLMLDFSTDPAGAQAVVMALRADPAMRDVPIIALTDGTNATLRIEALHSGVDEVLDRATPERLVQARMRSLMRARNASAELRDLAEMAGMAEAPASFAPPPRLAVIAADTLGQPRSLTQLLARLPEPAILLHSGRDLSVENLAPPPDIFLIDGVSGGADRMPEREIFRVLAELRSRATTQHAATMVLLSGTATEAAAMALDLGADDVASDRVSVEELSHRIQGLSRRKAENDRRRDNRQSHILAAVTDPMTGLYNRRFALPQLERIGDKARAAGRDFAVMVLDIDHFKQVNDTWGHATGDRVIIEVARRLRENLRAVDLVARIGGEEFLVAMPDTSSEQAQAAAERLRRIMAGTPFETGAPGSRGPLIDVTLSIGVAMGLANLSVPLELSELFDRADAALYAAKNAGRNMVTIARSAA